MRSSVTILREVVEWMEKMWNRASRTARAEKQFQGPKKEMGLGSRQRPRIADQKRSSPSIKL